MSELMRLAAERDFLLARAGHAGSCSFSNERWTGMSSNALVAVAFGATPKPDLPHDADDLAACYRTVMRLPSHLLTDKVFERLEAGERKVGRENVEWAKGKTEWPGATALRAQQGDRT